MKRIVRAVVVGVVVLGFTALILDLLTSGGGERSAPQEEPVVGGPLPTTPEAPQPPEPVIPGLRPSDVTANMANQGFDCVGPDSVNGEKVWSCSVHEETADYRVDIWGPDDSSVRYVEARFDNFDPSVNPTDELAGGFLGYVATVPYEGATPDKAQAWVQENVNTETTTQFAGVEYKLEGGKSAVGEIRLLTIRPPE